MNTISYSALRANLREVMDAVITNRTTYEVTRGEHEPVVMMSKHDYDSMTETLYLLSSSANAQRLQESIEQAAAGNVLHHSLTSD